MPETSPMAPARDCRILVIAGGGAKGAYSFGCLKAFKERGIYFHAVAGTSAGALNALLWSSDSLSDGETLWNEISFATIYPLRLLALKRFGRRFIRFIAASYCIMRLIFSSVMGVPTPYRPIWIALAYLLSPLLALPLIPLVIWRMSGTSRPLDIVLAWILVYAFVPIAYLFSLSRSRGGTAGLFLGMSVLLAVPFGMLLQDDSKSGPYGAIALGMGYLLLWNWILERTVMRADHSVLSASELSNIVEQKLTKGVNVPTFATTAIETEIFDPDRTGWVNFTYLTTVSGDTVIQTPVSGEEEPNTRTEWIPEYINVQNLKIATAKKVMLASAALPFGIVPPIRLGKSWCMDGGLADNCPVHQFLNHPQVREIYVLLLDPKTKHTAREIGAEPKRWKERDRLIRAAQVPIPKKMKDSPKDIRTRWQRLLRRKVNLPYIEPGPFPHLEYFAPKKSLGGFLDGTLRFEGPYAHDLMLLGYEDALEHLKEIDQRRAPSSGTPTVCDFRG